MSISYIPDSESRFLIEDTVVLAYSPCTDASVSREDGEEYLTGFLPGYDVVGHPVTNRANDVVAVVASGGRQPGRVLTSR